MVQLGELEGHFVSAVFTLCNPLDFFLWGYIKNEVFILLVTERVDAVGRVHCDMLQNVWYETVPF
jgi:hypothetical protein